MVRVSVVVAVRNGIRTLPALVDALEAQTLPSSAYEVLITDDGSTDGSQAWLADRFRDRSMFHHFSQEPAGPATGRNRGAERATGTVVAFTDADCVPDPDWLEVIDRRFAADESLLGLEGRTYHEPEAKSPFEHYVEIATGGFFATCNIAYRRAALAETGGFDLRFPYGHEDTELAIRIGRKGTIAFEPAMRVNHPPVRRSIRRWVDQYRRWIDDLVLYECQPEVFRCGHGGHGPVRAALVGRAIRWPISDLWAKRRFLVTATGEYLAYAGASLLGSILLFGEIPAMIRHAREADRRSVEVR